MKQRRASSRSSPRPAGPASSFGEHPGADSWPDGAVSTLAARHRLVIGEIAALAANRPAGPEEAAAHVRRTQRHRLGQVAQWVECSFTADDLVLPPSLREAIDDLVFE